MMYNKKFTGLVYFITGLIIFGFWELIVRSPLNILWQVLLMAVGSTMIYNLVYDLVYWVSSNNDMVKQYIFGKYYIDGYWAGFYRTFDQNDNEQYKLFYERIDQQIDATHIYGSSFFYDEVDESSVEKNEKKYKNYCISTQWHSYNVNFNNELDKIVYCMESERYRYAHISHGSTTCDFHQWNSKNQPIAMIGKNYTPEGGIAKRIDTYEEKIYIDKGKNIEEQLINECQRVFRERGKIFSKIKVDSDNKRS